MSYEELLNEHGLDWSASDEEILEIEGVGNATLEKIRAEEPRTVIADAHLTIKEDGEKMYVKPGDELPDWDLVDELLEKGQAKIAGD
jgi:hypothetical protein